MKSIGNKYHISIDEEANWKVMIGDTELFFDPEYRAEYNTIQWGYVKSPPTKFEKTEERFGPLANSGEKIYFHHQVHHKDNLVETETPFYIADPMQIFCSVVDGQIKMLNDFVLVKPIEEEDKKTASGIITEVAKTAYIPNQGIVHHVPEHGTAYGVNPGDKIFFTDNSDYGIEIEGEDYYLMQLHRDIPYVIESDGSINMLGAWGIVEPLDEGDDYEYNSGGILVQRKTNVQKHKGRVHALPTHTDWEVELDDEVIFDRKGHFKTVIDKKDYYCLNIERDILLLFCI